MKFILVLILVVVVACSYGLPTRSEYFASPEELELESYSNTKAVRRSRQSYGAYYYPSYEYSRPYYGGIRRRDVIGQPGQPQFEFQPIVKYKDTKTKRKKLFVPNLFG